MAKIPVKDSHNKALHTLDGSDKVFGDIRREHLVSEMVRYQMAKRRLGTHRAQTRSFVKLTGKKAYAQKGTGNARRGDFRAIGLVGGGVAFPPIPRDHSFDLPKKARKTAVRSVLSDKLRQEKLMVLDGHGMSKVKTKDASELLKRLGLGKALFVIPAADHVFERSMRNIPKVKVLRVDGLNVYDLLNYDQVVILKDALPVLEQRYQ